jgi:hypothetical protein
VRSRPDSRCGFEFSHQRCLIVLLRYLGDLVRAADTIWSVRGCSLPARLYTGKFIYLLASWCHLLIFRISQFSVRYPVRTISVSNWRKLSGDGLFLQSCGSALILCWSGSSIFKKVGSRFRGLKNIWYYLCFLYNFNHLEVNWFKSLCLCSEKENVKNKQIIKLAFFYNLSAIWIELGSSNS